MIHIEIISLLHVRMWCILELALCQVLWHIDLKVVLKLMISITQVQKIFSTIVLDRGINAT